MQADEYHTLAMRTKSHDQTPDQRMLNAVLGLCGEAGEIADMVKKHIYHGHALDMDDMIKEAGDLQWYIVQLADSLGVMLSDIMSQNIDKLMRRYPEGFSSAASRAREDTKIDHRCWNCGRRECWYSACQSPDWTFINDDKPDEWSMVYAMNPTSGDERPAYYNEGGFYSIDKLTRDNLIKNVIYWRHALRRPPPEPASADDDDSESKILDTAEFAIDGVSATIISYDNGMHGYIIRCTPCELCAGSFGRSYDEALAAAVADINRHNERNHTATRVATEQTDNSPAETAENRLINAAHSALDFLSRYSHYFDDEDNHAAMLRIDELTKALAPFDPKVPASQDTVRSLPEPCGDSQCPVCQPDSD